MYDDVNSLFQIMDVLHNMQDHNNNNNENYYYIYVHFVSILILLTTIIV